MVSLIVFKKWSKNIQKITKHYYQKILVTILLIVSLKSFYLIYIIFILILFFNFRKIIFEGNFFKKIFFQRVSYYFIIGTTIFLYLASAVLNWVNLFVPWGKGPGVHIARIIIETLNICIGLIQFGSYCTKFMANVKLQGVTDVMN